MYNITVCKNHGDRAETSEKDTSEEFISFAVYFSVVSVSPKKLKETKYVQNI